MEFLPDPYPHCVIDDFLPQRQFDELAKEFPGAEWKNWFEYDCEYHRKLVCPHWIMFPTSVWQAIKAMTKQDLDAEPDLGLWAAGMTLMRPGDVVTDHLDASHHKHTGQVRKYTSILFVEGDGDYIMLGGAKRISPKPNRLLVFENTETAVHSVSGVTETRKSLCLFWYGSETLRLRAEFV